MPEIAFIHDDVHLPCPDCQMVGFHMCVGKLRASLTTATGCDLDYLAALYGVERGRYAGKPGTPTMFETDHFLRQRVMTAMNPAPAAVLKPDPWVVVGTTTIDGTFEQVREAFGETWENVDHLSYALARGDQWNIGGRHLVVHSHEVFDGGVLVSFDIVRRQSEIDAESRLHPCVNCEDAPVDAGGTFCEGCTADLRATEVRPQCPECGPHGNRGRVALNFIEVACTTCAGGVPGDAFGRVAQDVVDDGPELTGDESVDVYGWECS